MIARIPSKKYSWELDEKAMLGKSTFKIPPSELINRCCEVLDNDVGVKEPGDLADDFTFQFPIIGPLSKTEYLEAVSSFQLKTMLPDLSLGVHGYHVDPMEPNRVWFFVRFQGTHAGDSALFGKATGKLVNCPPQVNSMVFNDDGKVLRYTGGYVVDKTMGNSGGMGGLFGVLYAIGRPLPFPEGKPWQPSLRFRAFMLISHVLKLLKVMLAFLLVQLKQYAPELCKKLKLESYLKA